MPTFDDLWNYNDPVGTEQKFRALLPKTVGPEHTELLTQIARTLGLQRKFEEAHQTLDQAEEELESGESGPRVRYLLERGRALNSSRKKDEARPLFQEAWEMAQTIGEDGLAVDAAHMLAIVETGDQALDWNLRALALATASPQPAARKWRKSLHNNIGWTLYEMGQIQAALENFQKCREAAEEMGDQESERIARWSIAKALRTLGQVEESFQMQRAQLDEAETENRDAPYVHEELGECLLALSRTAEAKPHLATAYKQLSLDPWLVENEFARLERLRRLSE